MAVCLYKPLWMTIRHFALAVIAALLVICAGVIRVCRPGHAQSVRRLLLLWLPLLLLLRLILVPLV